MTDQQPELVQRGGTVLAVRRARITMAELRDFYDAVYSDVARVVVAQGLGPTGPAVAAYHRFDPEADVVDVAAGFPTSAPVEPQDGVEPLTLPPGKVVRLEHVGSYDRLGDAHGRLLAWAAEQGLGTGVPFCETYVTEPSPGADPESMRTVIEHPVT